MPKYSTHTNYLSDFIRVKIDCNFPEVVNESDYDRWAAVLLGRDNWSAEQELKNENFLFLSDYLFLQSLVQILRLLCQLGRLPVFELPRVISLSRDDQNSKKYLLEIEIFLVHFLPKSVYQIPIKTSLELCRWMTQHSPTPENKSKVFNTITERVIKPLHQIVPAGKSTIPILQVAYDLGIPFTHLGLGVYQLGWGSKARRLDRSVCEFDSAIGSKLTQNKEVTTNLLRAAGLPYPTQGVVTTEANAIAMAKKIGFPVVIKPIDRDRGEGVTVDISDETALKDAFTHAQKLSKSKEVIVERQVSGMCHRLFIANGKLLYAVKRHPMSVIGDGKRTVKQLVADRVSEESQKPPWRRSEIKPVDELALKTLETFGLKSDSVPDKGLMVPLRRIESTEWGGVDQEVTKIIHKENLRVALEAAKLFNLHVAGIDIITPDITKPWHTNGAIINEVNFAPLFGGAAISRSHIPEFFAQFIKGDGKIPIELFDSEKAALEFQKEQAAQGRRCYVTDADRTIDEFGKVIVMPLKGLKQRIRALILRPDVDAIVMVHRDNNS
jgi:cyanophycin synthetase